MGGMGGGRRSQTARLAKARQYRGTRSAAARQHQQLRHAGPTTLPPLAAVKAGDADGISYILTEDDPFAAIDLDQCRRSVATCGRHLGTESSSNLGVTPIPRSPRAVLVAVSGDWRRRQPHR